MTKAEGSVNWRAAGDVHTIVLSGHLYDPESAALDAAIHRAVNAGARIVILDCSGLHLLDSQCLSKVISGYKALKSRTSGRIAFYMANENIKRLLSLTRMDQFIPVLASTEELEAFMAEAVDWRPWR